MDGHESSKRSWREALAVYADRRMLIILAMGFSSGLPYPLALGTLGWWLREVGVDLGTIGLFALVGAPYTFKFLWAPVMDQAAFPGLTRALGRRRGWAIPAQLGIAVAIVGVGGPDRPGPPPPRHSRLAPRPGVLPREPGYRDRRLPDRDPRAARAGSRRLRHAARLSDRHAGVGRRGLRARRVRAMAHRLPRDGGSHVGRADHGAARAR